MKNAPKEGPFEISFPCIKVVQPIGEFYTASIGSKDLVRITWADVRRLEEGEREFETYLGIQRPLNPKRVKELQEYVKTSDACFPSAVILAVESKCAVYDETTNTMTLRNAPELDEEGRAVIAGEIAKVLDGQHRIEGLRFYEKEDFQINVSLFVDIDIAEQSYIFSTVNLAQTKVSKSLVYDLFDLSRSRSPQKLCHNIAVALDGQEGSPLFHRIKRLGSATPGRSHETITQATFVEALLKYISKEPNKDRDLYMRGRKPSLESSDVLRTLLFRNMMIKEQDLELADILWRYFSAVAERWPTAWYFTGQGLMLNKTNGFRALMRFLKHVYLFIASPGQVPSQDAFKKVLDRIDLADADFNVDRYKPGSSGEGELYRELLKLSGLDMHKGR